MPSEHIGVPMATSSPRVARQFVAARLADIDRVDDVALLTSELVTNAVTHARSAADVTLRRDGRAVRVEVRDRDVAPPRKRRPDERGGRGLHLVEAIADRWGIETRHPGKVVWFEIDLRR